MSICGKFLGAACAIVLGSLSAPALADGITNFDGILDGNYANLRANNGGGSADSWGINGSGMFGFSPNWAGQVDGSYHNLSGGGHEDVYNIDGSAFWRADAGRIGAVVGYNSVNASGFDQNVTNYGAFGEWYATPSITFGVKGGGYNGSHSVDGAYAGANLTWYIHPDIALSGGYDYTHLNHAGNENDWTVKAEWLVSETTPFSIYGGYTNSDISHGGPTINTWFAGVRYYFDGDAAPLVARQRNGAETWGTSFGPTILKF